LPPKRCPRARGYTRVDEDREHAANLGDIVIPATLWTATVTLLIGLFYFYTGFRVGNLRAKHKILAPATSGHPEFDRAFRVQLNTLEQMGIILCGRREAI
jgi:hypothetical protein